tara:strand:- start:2198 stop:2914 length:717 start_codon:yes stop_codon:yes gene_type:complete
LNKKSILILGASSDIGNELIKIFLKNDWKVYAHYNKNSKIFKKKHILSKNNLKIIKADFSITKQFNKFSKLVKKFKIDSCVNLVGYLDNVSFQKTNLKSLTKSVQINAIIPLILQRDLIKKMEKKKFGRILNISSIGVKYGGSEFTFNYSYAKHSLEYIPSYIRKLAKKNILTNVLRVGVVDTKLHRKVRSKNIHKRVKLIPIKRMATIKEVSDTIYTLASEKNTYISGEVITIAGGE